jgi:protease-4
MQDSIFRSSLRSLMVGFFTVTGIGLALLLFSVLIAGLSTSATDTKLSSSYVEEVLPDAEGKRTSFLKTTPVVLQINIDGLIGTDELNMTTVRQQLIESREGDFSEDRVKALLLYINTPGGTVVDADGIYRAIKDYKEKYQVPVYAYVDGLCASGGMYIAAAADKIYSSDVSLVGSVGVLAPTMFNLTKLLEKIGIETVTLTAGKDKDAMNPFRPWKPGEEENYQELINYYYQHFLNVVTSNRPQVDPNKLVKEYGARVFNAPQAFQQGLIDQSGISLSDTIKALLQEANVEGDYQVIRLKDKNWWSTLFSSNANALLTGKIKHQLQLTPELESAFQGQFLYLYRP